jgi:hypothetical protein
VVRLLLQHFQDFMIVLVCTNGQYNAADDQDTTNAKSATSDEEDETADEMELVDSVHKRLNTATTARESQPRAARRESSTAVAPKNDNKSQRATTSVSTAGAAAGDNRRASTRGAVTVNDSVDSVPFYDTNDSSLPLEDSSLIDSSFRTSNSSPRINSSVHYSIGNDSTINNSRATSKESDDSDVVDINMTRRESVRGRPSSAASKGATAHTKAAGQAQAVDDSGELSHIEHDKARAGERVSTGSLRDGARGRADGNFESTAAAATATSSKAATSSATKRATSSSVPSPDESAQAHEARRDSFDFPTGGDDFGMDVFDHAEDGDGDGDEVEVEQTPGRKHGHEGGRRVSFGKADSVYYVESNKKSSKERGSLPSGHVAPAVAAGMKRQSSIGKRGRPPVLRDDDEEEEEFSDDQVGAIYSPLLATYGPLSE